FIINSVKAYDVEATIDLMKKLSHGGTVIIMLQNGIGSYELVAEKLANVKVAVGVAFIGSERDSPSSITYSGGKTIITGCPGRICYELKELQTVFIRGGCDFRITSNIDYYRWLKLALNSIVNPITALTRKRNKIILDEDARELVNQLIEEFIQVAKKYGFSFEKEGLVSYIIRNVELTRENKSSMLQDILRKKRTEIDYINGFLARELGRGSLNFFITRLIHLLEGKENGE
ncbi:MAG: 2-dehydropantoate 2-reductase, partial [Thermosphaera sp.]